MGKMKQLALELEEAHYYHTLSDFASLVKILGAERVIDDLFNYQEEAYDKMYAYFMDTYM